MDRSLICLMLTALLTLAGTEAAVGRAAEAMSLEQLRQARHQLAHRQRRVIMNNDGCDVLYFSEKEKTTVEGFLAQRTTPLAGTQVDALAYCSISSGFSYFTHNTKAGTVLARSGREFGILPDTRNISQELIDLGTDCLQAVVDFGHQHQMEVFWSMRMNDTHDAAHRPDTPYFLFPPLKYEHPEWLVGEPVKRTPHGRWSSVDYARPEIRDLAFRYLEEVCRNYDVDGIELDFFRHLCYFKSTASGGVASDEERAVLTELMARVRKMTEDVGSQRGRPILVAVRVPDSVGFCRDMGFDLERWLGDRLFDLLITTCYFRLNPWECSVQLGHKHDVPVYPCLSDSRVRGETRFRRASPASYRGRAMNAWAAGADGLHVFNFFNPKAPMWAEIGDPEALATMDKLYFVSVRDGDPRSYLAGGREYRTVPLLGPSQPRMITASQPANVDIVIGDDVPAVQSRGYQPAFKLHLETPAIGKAEQLHVRWNGAELSGGKVQDGWVDYLLPPAGVKRGANEVQIAVEPSGFAADEWSVAYDGSAKPGRQWSRDPGSPRTEEELIDGALRIADRGESGGDYLYYRYAWGADPQGETVAEARVKVISGSSFLIVSNGVGGERLGLWPDRIELFHNRQRQFKMDTTDDFHVYRMELKGPDLKVYVDGELRIDAPGAMGPRGGSTSNDVAFGAANSGMMGEACWDHVQARASGLICRDLVVSAAFARP
ncbi:MAG: hypothetical protein GX575_04650 [Candidatus Anammoximicrobium sp.]|nr:hypothetical protein [Candidatus Anammoximicrobium sp.]